jgi:hypothetical protein
MALYPFSYMGDGAIDHEPFTGLLGSTGLAGWMWRLGSARRGVM